MKFIRTLWERAVPDPAFRAALADKGISNLAELETTAGLNMSGTDLRGVNWEGLRYATAAHSLAFYGGTYLQGNASEISGLTGLTYLNLSSTLIAGTLSDFAALVNLGTLALDNANVSGDLSAINNLSKLTWLTLSGLDILITDTTLIAQRNLSRLALNNCGLGRQAVDAVLAACVTSLSLPGRVACNLTIQDNTAPSEQGLADVDTLVAASWTVTHD